jgi:hypothetical protein
MSMWIGSGGHLSALSPLSADGSNRIGESFSRRRLRLRVIVRDSLLPDLAYLHDKSTFKDLFYALQYLRCSNLVGCWPDVSRLKFTRSHSLANPDPSNDVL